MVESDPNEFGAKYIYFRDVISREPTYGETNDLVSNVIDWLLKTLKELSLKFPAKEFVLNVTGPLHDIKKLSVPRNSKTELLIFLWLEFVLPCP